jgi:hypothetical protein
VTVQRIHQLINEGRLPAQKLGRDYVINEQDLKLVENRKPGRPPKQPAAQARRLNDAPGAANDGRPRARKAAGSGKKGSRK